MNRSLQPEGYEDFLQELKQRIRTAQMRAAVAVNRELKTIKATNEDATG